MEAAQHPNAQLHEQLSQAARQGKLTADFIQSACKAPSLPFAERNASAYVNWNTTLSLLGKAPAKSWFAGVSKPTWDNNIIRQPQDKLRDDLSVGVYYWWSDVALPETGHFTVDMYKSENVLFIDVFDHKTGRCVALFDGTPTMNVQIQGGNFSFEGDGLWGGQNVKK